MIFHTESIAILEYLANQSVLPFLVLNRSILLHDLLITKAI